MCRWWNTPKTSTNNQDRWLDVFMFGVLHSPQKGALIMRPASAKGTTKNDAPGLTCRPDVLQHDYALGPCEGREP